MDTNTNPYVHHTGKNAYRSHNKAIQPQGASVAREPRPASLNIKTLFKLIDNLYDVFVLFMLRTLHPNPWACRPLCQSCSGGFRTWWQNLWDPSNDISCHWMTVTACTRTRKMKLFVSIPHVPRPKEEAFVIIYAAKRMRTSPRTVCLSRLSRQDEG